MVLLPIIATRIWSPSSGVVESNWYELWVFGFLLLPMSILGALMAAKRPENRIGWIMLAFACSMCLSIAFHIWDQFAQDVSGPTVGWGEWVGAAISLVPILGIFTIFPLLFPDGHLPSRRWWPALVFACFALVIWIFSEQFNSEIYNDPATPDAVRIAAFRDIVSAIGVVGYLIVGAAVLMCVAALVVRARRSRGIERQQIKLFAYTAAVVSTAFVVSGADNDTVASISWIVALTGVTIGFPVTIAVAILRYHLFDIDRLISRSVSWLLVTLVLGAAYLLAVVGMGVAFRSLSGSGSQLAVAASTLIVAALFRPVRGRIQGAVDRRFNRRRYDAALAVDAFRLRLRDEIDLTSVTEEIRQVVHDTVQPTFVSVWTVDTPAGASTAARQ
jgi:hypothetical protein